MTSLPNTPQISFFEFRGFLLLLNWNFSLSLTITFFISFVFSCSRVSLTRSKKSGESGKKKKIIFYCRWWPDEGWTIRWDKNKIIKKQVRRPHWIESGFDSRDFVDSERRKWTENLSRRQSFYLACAWKLGRRRGEIFPPAFIDPGVWRAEKL